MYDEEDFLLLSGVQHFAFCRRQWALIYIEGLWTENLRTVEGQILHEKAHDRNFTEKRGDVVISRGMPVFSRALGTNGACDIVELQKNESGVSIFGRDGLYLPVPVEYKRGRPKEGDEDALQLAAQAICLEEMMACDVPVGYLYYGETGRRTKVPVDSELRGQVFSAFQEMHGLFDRRHTPKVKTSARCRACSLFDLCMPKLCKERSAAEYISGRHGEADD